MGMTYSEYWEGDSWLVEDYRQADRLKQQRASDEAWLQGMYIYNAFGVVLSNAFSGKTQPQKYLEKPIRVIPKTKFEIQQEELAERNKVIKYLTSLKDKFEKNKEENNHE